MRPPDLLTYSPTMIQQHCATKCAHHAVAAAATCTRAEPLPCFSSTAAHGMLHAIAAACKGVRPSASMFTRAAALLFVALAAEAAGVPAAALLLPAGDAPPPAADVRGTPSNRRSKQWEWPRPAARCSKENLRRHQDVSIS
eukprot:1161024-Pelagomonas_calceolata.AAC.9